MPIDFDKLESIQRKSTYAPKDKYKRSSFNPNAYSIDNKLLLNLRKHSGNSQNIVPGNVNAYIEARARNQSTWDRIGNALAQTVGEIIGGTIESAGSILALPSKLFGDDEAYTRNFLERIGNSINEGTREAFPIYMTEQAQNGSLLDRMKGGGYWASMVPSVLGSAASIMLPARGASLLLGKAFRSAVNLGSKSKYAKDLFKLGTELQKAKALNRADKIADIYGSAVIGRILDSSREAYGTYEQERQWFLDNYKNYTEYDENGNPILKMRGLEEVPLTDETIERLADQYADTAASRGYWRSMSNIAYDIVEWMNILGTAKTLSNATRANIRKAMATGDKFAIVRTLNAMPQNERSQLLKTIGGFAAGSLSEMADEMTMSIAMKEGVHSARKDFGLLSDTDALTDFSQRIGSYLSDADIWTEGIGGLLGGAGMQAIMPFIETKLNKKGIERDQMYVKGLETAVESMRAGLDGIVESLANGDIVSAKIKEQEAILNQVAANQLDGSLELYKEMLRNMSASLKEIQALKDKRDKNEALTAEEQLALDKGESLLANANYFEQTLNKIEAVESIYKNHFDSIDGSTDKNEYEYHRRLANLEAQKKLNELEIANITANPEEYAKREAESKNYINDYVDSKYSDETARLNKKASISEYAKQSANLESIKEAIRIYDELIANLKKRKDEIEKSIANAPKDITPEQLLSLKIALKGANSKLENNNKILKELQANRDASEKAIEDLNLNQDDKDAAKQARTMLANLTNPKEAKEFFNKRNVAIDAEIDYYLNGDGYNNIKDEIKLYEDEIKASNNKDLMNELDTYKTSDSLEKDKAKFSNTDERLAAYNARLNRLKKQEADSRASIDRQTAAINAEKQMQQKLDKDIEALKNENQNDSLKDNTSHFGKSSKDFMGVKELSKDAIPLYNNIISEAQVLNTTIDDVINSKLKKKYLTSKDTMLLNEIKDFNERTIKALENSFDTQTATNINAIVTRLATKYSIFDNIAFGLRFQWIDSVTNQEIVYAPNRNSGDIASELNTYLKHLSRYTAQVLEANGKPLPSFLADIHFGLKETTKDDINKLTNKILQDAKAIQTKFDLIDSTIDDNLGRKNPRYNLYVSIGGIEYRVINTPNPRKDVGLRLEGFESQINRYVLTPANMSNPNDDYILITRQVQYSAPDQSHSPTGSLEAQQSSTNTDTSIKTDIKEDVSNSSAVNTEFQSDEHYENSNDAPIEFIKASNQPVIDFKIDGLDLESINNFLVSLLSQNDTNMGLFDPNLLNGLVLVPKLLRKTKGKTAYNSDAYIKDLMNKYFTDAKLNKTERQIIDAAIKLSTATIITIESNSGSIRLNNAGSAKEAVDALNLLKDLYSNENDFESDMSSIDTALNASFEFDIVSKMAEVLTSDSKLNSDAIAIRLDETLHNKYALISQDLGGIFVDNFNLFGSLVAFISDRSGFKVNKINYYDLINGMREYRGDNYKNLIPEIMSVINITNFLKTSFKTRSDYYNAKFRETKDNIYKDLYNNYNFFYELIDTEATNDMPLTEAQVINFIKNTPEVISKTYHEGLDINFDSNGGPTDIINNVTTSNLGIYEIISDIHVGDEVTLVKTDLEENPNKASYDIIINRNGKEYKLGSLPKLETIENGIAYVIEGANGQYYPRKFAFTDEMANTFAEYQREIFRFMYYYDRAFNNHNNISAKDKEDAEHNIEIIFDVFRKDRFKNLMDAFKQLVYSNLTSKQIQFILDSETLTSIVDSEYEGSTDGEIDVNNVALSYNQIYQICLDLFPASRITNSNMQNIINADGIKKHFDMSINRHEMIFKNNQAIRTDLRVTGSNTFRISHISAGRVLINDEAKTEDKEAKQGLPIMHHRNSLINSIKPTKDVLDSTGKPRVQIVYIDKDGTARDPKTGGLLQNVDKFASNHTGNIFIGNRQGISVVIPQTDDINTMFPTSPNTIMGSITDKTEQARIIKLNKYNKYIGDAIKEILALKTGNISEARLEISDRLQNIIICNEKNSAEYDDIYFQSDNTADGSKRFVMMKAVLGEGKGKIAYHKFIQTEIDGREAIIHYTSGNKLDVANYNGALNHPSYPHTVYYLDTPADVQKFNNKLNSIIPNLVRQFGLKDGLAISKDSNNSSYTTGYTDPITGEQYEDIYDYYMATNAIYSDVASIKDKYGNVVSNVSIGGNSPIKYSITTTSFDNNVDVVQRFYDPVQLLKTVQDANRYKEDWSSIAELANILEYEAGINPVYVKHNVSRERIFSEYEGATRPVKKSDDITGFYRNQFRIDVNYNWEFANEKDHQGYLTRTLAHEMIHSYILKFFNATSRDINNPERLAQREALIEYNNKEWEAWFNDFIAAINNARKDLATKTDLNERDQFLKDMLKDGGIVNKLIQVITKEFNDINKSIASKLEARANGAKVVISGQDAVSEIITYALTDPRIFRLLNELKSTTDRVEGSENIETPTFWEKFKKVLLNIFQKIFGVIDTKVNADSLMERLNDTINRIYNKDFRDMDANVTVSSIQWNSVAPDREGAVVGSGISAETSEIVTDNPSAPIIETESQIESQTQTEETTETEENEDDIWEDDIETIHGDLKLSTVLSDEYTDILNKAANNSLGDLKGDTDISEIINVDGTINFDKLEEITNKYFKNADSSLFKKGRKTLRERQEKHFDINGNPIEANTLEHLINVTKSASEIDIKEELKPILILAAALHDIAKPFHGGQRHGFQSVDVINSIFKGNISPLVKFAVRHHMFTLEESKEFTIDDAKRIIQDAIDNNINVQDAMDILLALNTSDIMMGQKPFDIDRYSGKTKKETIENEIPAKRKLLELAAENLLNDVSKVVDENGEFSGNNNTKYSITLTDNISKYLYDSAISLNKNNNFDVTNKRIC